MLLFKCNYNQNVVAAPVLYICVAINIAHSTAKRTLGF